MSCWVKANFVFQTPAFGPFVTDRDRADEVSLDWSLVDSAGADGRPAIAGLVVPATAKTQIPAFAAKAAC
jgi:hypothetical protein